MLQSLHSYKFMFWLEPVIQHLVQEQSMTLLQGASWSTVIRAKSYCHSVAFQCGRISTPPLSPRALEMLGNYFGHHSNWAMSSAFTRQELGMLNVPQCEWEHSAVRTHPI